MTESPPSSSPDIPPWRGAGAKGLTLASVWRAIHRHRFRVLGLGLVCGLVAWLYASSLAPVYRAETTLLVDYRGQGVDGPMESSGGPTTWLSERDVPLYLKTQTLLMTSRTLAEAVVDRLGLVDDPALIPSAKTGLQLRLVSDWLNRLPAFLRERLPQSWLAARPDANPDPFQARAAAVEAVRHGLRAEVMDRSELVRLSFSVGSPELAARVANAAADAYLDAGMESRLQALTKATAWLTGRLEGLRERVEASESRLQAFREAEGLTDADRALDLEGRQLQDLAGRLVQARATRDKLRRFQDQLQSLTGGGDAATVGSALPIANAAIQALQTAEGQADREVAELAKRYGPKHPKMLAAQSTLDSLRGRLDTAIRDAVTGAQRDLTAADAQIDQFETELATLKDKAKAAGRQEQRLRELKRTLETDRQLYDTFLARFKVTGQGVEGEAAPARVIDPALEPARSVGPPVVTIVTVAVLLGLMLGAISALGSDFQNDMFRGGSDLQESLGVPLLGSIPLLGRWQRHRSSPERLLVERPQSDFAEAIRSLRAGLILAGMDRHHSTLLVTSSAEGEGKTTLAINMALILGRSSRTLLIDANLRRPRIGLNFGLAADAPGLCDLVAGSEGAASIHRIDDLPVDVLPIGTLPDDPMGLLSSPRLGEILADLAPRYGYVVIDATPAMGVSDALVVARLCDAAVLVVGADTIRASVVHTALGRLRQAGTPRLGVVLNRVG